MNFESVGPEGLVIIQPRIFSDERGAFMETFNEKQFLDAGLPIHFFQDNESISAKGVLRGLHFQKPPYEQGKLVRVVHGSALDVAVDIRKNSRTYGRHFKIVLDAKQPQFFFIPPGFAHGFLALEENTVFLYKCTTPYNPSAEGTLAWNDPDLNIDWGISHPALSTKDMKGKSFSNFLSPF
jgi:dTDP-4-dehydrorhamnose 3,5-epimerase